MSSALRFSVIMVLLLAAASLGMIAYTLNQPKAVQVMQPEAPAPMATLMVPYLVAAHPLPAGTLARDEDFTTSSAASGTLPSDAIADSPEARAGLRGSLVRRYVDGRSVITQADVLRPRDRGFLASVLDPGTRAISINVDAETGVSGLLWPGDRVDVVLTQENDKASRARRALSETILRDVRIIGIDQDIVQGASSGTTAAGKVARTVTLQVAPAQVERVTVAGHLGKLSLAMRSAQDQPDSSAVREGTTYSSDVSRAIASEIGATVRVFEGDQSRQLSFRASGDAR